MKIHTTITIICIEAKYFGADSKPTLTRLGTAKITEAYDVRGAMERVVLLGVNDEPVLARGGGFSSAEILHDDHGNFVGLKMFGADGKLTIASAGTAGFRSTFDDRGDQIEKTFIGEDGAPKPPMKASPRSGGIMMPTVMSPAPPISTSTASRGLAPTATPAFVTPLTTAAI